MKRSQLVSVGLGAAALLLAGCGSSGGAAATTTPTNPSVGGGGATVGPTGGSAANPQRPNSAAFSKFQACLKQHGVTGVQGAFGFRRNQQGGAGGAAPSARPSVDAKTQAAFSACRSLLPQGGFGSGGRRLMSTPQFAAFQTCMRDHGVTIALPVNDTATAGSAQAPSGARRGFLGLDLTNPKTKAAYDTCKVLLPSGGGFGRPDTATALSPNPGPSA